LVKPAIHVRELSKRYQVRQAQTRATYRTLRETLTEKALTAIQRWRRNKEVRRGEDFWALRDVSFEIETGEVVGIIGRNGAGKSTLLKILSRITKPSSGEVELRGRVGSLLEVGTGFHPELTGRENVYLNGAILGMTRKEIQKQFDAIVDFAGIQRFLETPVKRYSSGMYVRLAFAVAAHLNPEILVVDEVLAVGDAEFQRKCLGRMKDVATSGRTVLFVSHNMAAIQSLCTRAVLLASGRVSYTGDVNSVITKYLAEATNSEAIFDRGPLKWVRARQIDEVLLIEAAYEHTSPLLLPSLGFVVSDVLGSPVFGLNPKLSGIDRVAPISSAGVVRASIRAPRLVDGQYRLSIWFGDGYQDFVSHQDCITFEVTGWAGPRQLPARVVGSAFPECTWEFDGPEVEVAI